MGNKLSEIDLERRLVEEELRCSLWRETYWHNIEDGEVSAHPPPQHAGIIEKVTERLLEKTESTKALELAMKVLKEKEER